MTLFGAVEMGGTKTDMAVGTSLADMSPPRRIDTADPQTTLRAVVDYMGGHGVDSVGVASFGPLQLDRARPRYGSLMLTPKQGWTGVPVYETLSNALAVPVVLDTDVNGAALGEGRWGATSGMDNHAYVTVGTGIGAGIVVGGRLISSRGHPELGHIVVSLLDGDIHPGSCPYHRGCLEGMASGPALETRFGRPETWAGDDSVLDLATHYIAQALASLFYTTAPERIVVGGGVSRLPGFHERLRTRVGAQIADYPETPDLELLVAAPGLGERSGLAGALLLAASG